MSQSNLYFILNPALGIIKIGISTDVEARRCSLEHACGVSLALLGVLEGGGHFEDRLHLIFGDTRLLGEWFLPSEELLALAAKPLSVPAFVAANGDRAAAWEQEIERRADQRKAARMEASAAERAEEERLRLKARELEAKREDAKAKRAAAEDRKRLEQEEERRRQVEAARVAWTTRNPELVERVRGGKEFDLAEERRALIASSQRARNAATVGVVVAVKRQEVSHG